MWDNSWDGCLISWWPWWPCRRCGAGECAAENPPGPSDAAAVADAAALLLLPDTHPCAPPRSDCLHGAARDAGPLPRVDGRRLVDTDSAAVADADVLFRFRDHPESGRRAGNQRLRFLFHLRHAALAGLFRSSGARAEHREGQPQLRDARRLSARNPSGEPDADGLGDGRLRPNHFPGRAHHAGARRWLDGAVPSSGADPAVIVHGGAVLVSGGARSLPARHRTDHDVSADGLVLCDAYRLLP